MNDPAQGSATIAPLGTTRSRRVVIVVLNWNGWPETQECLRRLVSLDHPDYRIVVVDNASTDGSESKVRVAFPEVDVLQAGANNGYAAGNNIGIRHALVLGGQYILLLNNDAFLSSQALFTMVGALDRFPQLGAVGPTQVSAESGDLRVQCAGTLMDHVTGKPSHAFEIPTTDKPTDYLPVPYLTGSCILFRAEVARLVGPLPEQYFLYFEDCDWCYSIRRHGWDLGYVPAASIVHLVNASTRKNKTLIPYYFTRNFWLFISRNPEATASLWHARRLHFEQSTTIMRALANQGDLRAAIAMLKGTIDGILGRAGKRRTGLF